MLSRDEITGRIALLMHDILFGKNGSEEFTSVSDLINCVFEAYNNADPLTQLLIIIVIKAFQAYN